MLTEVAKCAYYIKLFKGCDTFQSGGAELLNCIHFLKGKSKEDRAKIMVACIILIEKPTDLLLTGLYRNKDGTRRDRWSAISVDIAKYLPKIEQETIGATELKNDVEMTMRRREWPEEFKMVNMPMVLRCAYIMLQYVQDVMPKVGLDWIRMHGGNRPLDAVLPDKFVGKSRKFRQDVLDKFKMEHGIVAADADFTVLNYLGW